MGLQPLLAVIADVILYGALVIALAAVVGYLVARARGAALGAALALAAVMLCAVAAVILDIARPTALAIAGLVLLPALTLAVTGWALSANRSARQRGALTLAGLWLALCGAIWLGYLGGGRVGLMTITVPAVVLFGGALAALVPHILPLAPDQPQGLAARALLTYLLGINYPFYALVERELVKRVDGRATEPYPAGPGIVLTGPDHVVAVSDGLSFRGVRGPGVIFTRQFETALLPMDLRPQQREFSVEAITRDGILVRMSLASVFQLDAREPGQPQPVPALGHPFPHHERLISRAYHARPVEITRTGNEGGAQETRRQRRWDELVEIVGTHTLQDIIGEHSFSELCAPLDPQRDPRQAVTTEYRRRMAGRMPEYGIQHLTANITDLQPLEGDSVRRQQVANWQAQWQRRMLEELGAAEAEAEVLMGQAHAQVQAEVIGSMSEALADATPDDRETAFTAVALRFVESLNRMIERSQLAPHLPEDVVTTIGQMPHVIGGEPPAEPQAASSPAGPPE